MKKADFINEVAEKTSLSKKDVKAVVEASIETIIETLKKGEDVSFMGFGTFTTGIRKAREAKVPNTDKIVKIPESKVAKFKVGKVLKDSLNNK